jgi:hypothetical protein
MAKQHQPIKSLTQENSSAAQVPIFVEIQKSGSYVCHAAEATMNGGTCKNLEDIIQLVVFVNEKICNYLLSFLCNIGE